MQTDPNAPRVKNAPDPVPEDMRDLQHYLFDELSELWSVMQQIALGHMPKTHVAPDKPRDGMVRYADGSDWDPGTGEGIYAYYNSTWNRMG